MAETPQTQVHRHIGLPSAFSPDPPKGCSHGRQTRDARQGRETEGLIPIDLLSAGCGSHAKGMWAARGGGAGRDCQGSMRQETRGDRPC